MPAASLPASPTDIQAIVTSLGVFGLAIAAVVGGIYKGLKEIKKGGADTGNSDVAGLIVDNITLRALTDSNLRLIEIHREIVETLRQFDHRNELLIEALKDAREMTRSHAEEQHRLRAAIVDLVEIMRRR